MKEQTTVVKINGISFESLIENLEHSLFTAKNIVELALENDEESVIERDLDILVDKTTFDEDDLFLEVVLSTLLLSRNVQLLVEKFSKSFGGEEETSPKKQVKLHLV